jgi:hypothetical protein
MIWSMHIAYAIAIDSYSNAALFLVNFYCCTIYLFWVVCHWLLPLICVVL